MLTVLLSWVPVFVASYLFGYIIIHAFYSKKNEILQSIDVYIVCGLIFINVYAQIFSLFHRVSLMACVVLFILGGVFWVMYAICKKGRIFTELWKQWKRISFFKLMIGVAIVLVIASWTVHGVAHIDTPLYHMQAVFWVERYGVIPGLGNLHNRFAYNSAFVPLQALFSFRWLVGQSLHTVNGYICCVSVIYAVFTSSIWKRGSLKLSDLFKFVIILYVFQFAIVISSPSTDTLAMILALYIAAKWSELLEHKAGIEGYAFLCEVAVYAITVKLSAAFMMVLAIYPAIQLIKYKKWKSIVGHLGAGVAILIPWIIRNIIISGYLLYPYFELDLFRVDWKMPRSILEYDRQEIIAYGRGQQNVEVATWPIQKWFPDWFIDGGRQLLILCGLIACVILIIWLFCNLIKTEITITTLVMCVVLNVFGWLFSAPLLRYGIVYLYMPICVVISLFLKKMKRNQHVGKCIVMVICCILPISNAPAMIGNWERNSDFYLKQIDYRWYETKRIELSENISIWVPVEGVNSSVDVFPCVPYINMVDKIEPRGETLKDGFRVQEKYRYMRINEMGCDY